MPVNAQVRAWLFRGLIRVAAVVGGLLAFFYLALAILIFGATMAHPKGREHPDHALDFVNHWQVWAIVGGGTFAVVLARTVSHKWKRVSVKALRGIMFKAGACGVIFCLAMTFGNLFFAVAQAHGSSRAFFEEIGVWFTQGNYWRLILLGAGTFLVIAFPPSPSPEEKQAWKEDHARRAVAERQRASRRESVLSSLISSLDYHKEQLREIGDYSSSQTCKDLERLISQLEEERKSASRYSRISNNPHPRRE
jgi:hypothetical protein